MFQNGLNNKNINSNCIIPKKPNLPLKEQGVIFYLNLMESLINSFSKVHIVNKGTGAGGANTNLHGKSFENKTCTEQQLLENGYTKVLIDKKSVLYLFGTELDFSDGLNGKGFEWINPNASRTCGCGESFAV